jgi:hypothetical protein
MSVILTDPATYIRTGDRRNKMKADRLSSTVNVKGKVFQCLTDHEVSSTCEEQRQSDARSYLGTRGRRVVISFMCQSLYLLVESALCAFCRRL